MNGIKYIREKSNISKNALAERIGVTRQTITLWEKGTRKPDPKHLRWLRDFYGISEKWFRDLSDDEIQALNKIKMYHHFDGNKDFFTFIPEKDGYNELSIECGELTEMLSEKHSDVFKKKSKLMKRIDKYLMPESDEPPYIFDKIIITERGTKEVNTYLDLLDILQEVGKQGSFLKVTFRYEISTIIYALMVASETYTVEEIKAIYEEDFSKESNISIDEQYLTNLISIMSSHWKSVEKKAVDNRYT